MREIELFDDESGATVFRDVIMLALVGFVTLVLLLLPHLNPRATAEDSIHSPGTLSSSFAGRMRSMPTSTFGCKHQVMCRSATPTKAVLSLTSCATTSAIPRI